MSGVRKNLRFAIQARTGVSLSMEVIGHIVAYAGELRRGIDTPANIMASVRRLLHLYGDRVPVTLSDDGMAIVVDGIEVPSRASGPAVIALACIVADLKSPPPAHAELLS